MGAPYRNQPTEPGIGSLISARVLRLSDVGRAPGLKVAPSQRRKRPFLTLAGTEDGVRPGKIVCLGTSRGDRGAGP